MKPHLIFGFLILGIFTFASPTHAAESPSNIASLVKEHRNSLVFVEGKSGQGSGFIADIKGKKFLLTNIHVLAGVRPPQFTLLDRTPVKVRSAAAAVGHDIGALEVVSGGTAIPTVESVENETSIGDAVVVLGNAEGAGVVNLIQGNIVGIGPNLVEVDAPFVPGNSGSPIIHIRSGKVIGIATYLTVKQVGPREQKVRRFGYRIDSVQNWQPIEWSRFYSEADMISRIEKTGEELVSLLEDLGKNGQPTRAYTSPAIKNAIDTLGKAKQQNGSRTEANRSVETMLNSLRSASISDVKEARQRIGYDFFQKQLETQERERGEISNIFDQAIKRQRK